MAIIQGLLALIARQASKLLNTAFGWATILLFGKVSEDRQIYLSVIALGSVAWLVVLLGLLISRVGHLPARLHPVAGLNRSVVDPVDHVDCRDPHPAHRRPDLPAAA